MRLAKLIILSILFSAIRAQETPKLHEVSLSGIKKITTRHFDYDGLWGYINGGADIYFEYGFEHVTAQNIRINGSDFKMDVYRMRTPEAAYGIYSVSKFRCAQTNALNEYDCLTPYQYLAARGHYFLSVANTTGSKNEQETGLRIAEKCLALIDELPLQLPEVFSHSVFEHGRKDLKLIYGPLGMQNGFMHWDEMFAGLHDYEAWVIPLELHDTRFHVGFIKFETEEIRDRFITRNKIAITDPAKLEPSVEIKKYAFILKYGMLLYDGKLPEKMLLPLKELINGR